MAIETGKYYLTTAGNKLIREALEGKALTVTTMKFGDGALPTTVDGVTALTALMEEKQSFRINSVESDDTYTRVKSVATNEMLESGYYIRECGLFCLDTTTGNEVMIAVEKTEEQYMPAKDSTRISFVQTMVLTLGNAELTLSVDNDAYLLKEDALTIDKVYPVGSVYLTLGTQDPNSLFSGTTWERVAGGTALLSAGDDYSAGTVYGANRKKIERKNLPAESLGFTTESAGNHTHRSVDFLDEIGFDVTNGGGGDPEKLRLAMGDNSPWNGIRRADNTGTAGSHTHSGRTENLGSGEAMDVMQASLAINVWKRTA